MALKGPSGFNAAASGNVAGAKKVTSGSMKSGAGLNKGPTQRNPGTPVMKTKPAPKGSLREAAKKKVQSRQALHSGRASNTPFMTGN